MSLFALGSLVGALLGGPTSVWAGRRATLVIGVVVSIIGYNPPRYLYGT